MRVFAERPAAIPMDADTQLRVCIALVGASARHACDDLDKMFAVETPFRTVCESRELRHHVDLIAYGHVTDERDIERYIRDGYDLCNYQPGRLSIHYPDRAGGGICTYIIGELAEKYGKRHDAWNYGS